MFKRFLCTLLTAAMLISVTACSSENGVTEDTGAQGSEAEITDTEMTEAGNQATEAAKTGDTKDTEAASCETTMTKIVCTIYPEYDWVREIIKGHESSFEVSLLMDKGTDLHSYQPTVEDISLISRSDIFIYVGGESDEWVEDALENTSNQNLTALNLMGILGDAAKEEELVEGMQGEEEPEVEEVTSGTDVEEEVEYDEHVWLSLRNARTFVKEIANAIAEKDPECADDVISNAEAYGEMLNKLDNQYMQMVDDVAGDTLIFGDRFPFRYMVDDYGLNYYAAFVGCSAETEASFETVAFLAEKLNEVGTKSVMVIEGSDGKIANTIIQTAGAKDCSVLTLDSLQSYQVKYTDEDKTYLQAMMGNMEVLRKALDY